MKRVLAYIALIALTLTFFSTPQAQAAPRERCFSETGYCVSGVILDYWERNGGLPVFGYPIGPLQIETVEGTWSGPVQWFERDRLEDHTNENKGVLAGRLGARYLELTGRPWKPGNDAPQPARNLCTKFDVTGYNVCAPFSSYWQKNGGLERFGYPITPAFQEQVEGKTYLVQYFERRRMEYHPENAGTQYEILLGLLGRDVRQFKGPVCKPSATSQLNTFALLYQERMQCPAPGHRSVQIVSQLYENGQMLWVPGDQRTPATIYVLIPTSTGMVAWSKFTDTYVEGEDIGAGQQPPAGRYAPVRGFGKLWWKNTPLRGALGWAISPETTENADILTYAQHEGRIIHRTSIGTIDVFFPNGEYTQAAAIP